MPGAPGDLWPLMPQTSAHAIPDVRLEYDHGTHLSGSFALHHLQADATPGDVEGGALPLMASVTGQAPGRKTWLAVYGAGGGRFIRVGGDAAHGPGRVRRVAGSGPGLQRLPGRA